MNDTTLYTFPANKVEALAMLYVQNQELSNRTPAYLLDLYYEAYDKIRAHEKEVRAERQTTRTNS